MMMGKILTILLIGISAHMISGGNGQAYGPAYGYANYPQQNYVYNPYAQYAQPPFYSPFPDFLAQQQRFFSQLQEQFNQQQAWNRNFWNNAGANNYAPNPYPDSTYSVNEGTNYAANPNVASAQSAISVGPQGGFQAGQISPVGPGIASRFGAPVAPPSGGNFGVFSSSSASSQVGPDGKVVTSKKAITGINDNGKITVHKVED